jgi:hypothetical protein
MAFCHVFAVDSCGAIWRETMPVHEVFQGKTVWQDNVEVFDLHGHAKAKRAYAWSHREGKNDEGERFFTALEIAPVESAVTAVRVQNVKDIKTGHAK